MMRRSIPLAALMLALWSQTGLLASDDSTFERKSDVIYGRKYGTALTMDVFTPKQGANGASVVLVISGGYFSSHEAISPVFLLPLLNRGYTVFAVVHGSQPRYTVSDILIDVNRAIRFIRHHAKDYAVDPNRIGVTGASAGGHLSLMLGTSGQDGDPNARDPVDRESSHVQAVACFFPPTDFLNYGAAGHEMIHPKDFGQMFRPAFDYHELDRAENLWVPVKDEEKLRAIARKNSPIMHVTPDDAPTLIYHGDADTLVPLQQSESIVEKLKAAKVDAKLVVKAGAGHGWLSMGKDMEDFANWFDAHLKGSK
jgi:acetyl esterase/lipase